MPRSKTDLVNRPQSSVAHNQSGERSDPWLPFSIC